MQQSVAQSPHLIDSLQRYADLFTFAPVGYVVLRDDGTVEDLNRMAAGVLGWPRTWVVGQPFVRWVADADAGGFRRYFGEVYAAEGPVTGEFRVRDRKGRLKYLRFESAAMLARGGERLCQAAVFNVTEQRAAARNAKALQEELAHAARLNSCGEMVAALAHELNQPLGAIMLYCRSGLKSLRADGPTRDRLEPALEKIGAAAELAAGTIKSLRSFLGKGEPVVESVDVNAALADGVRMAAAYAKERGGRVELELAPDLPEWRGNRVHLQQVLLNLLQNSLDAMRDARCEDPVVTVKSRRAEGQCLRVTVEDCGPGMTPMQRRKALEPFFTTKKNGMGVGLPISRSLIESYGGRLDVASGAAGGAAVSFTLPLKQGD